MSSMPLSRSTPATAPMTPSVFRDISLPSTFAIVQSGMMPSEKIFVCLTWPAMTACDTPAFFSRLMQVPSWPERDPVNLAAGPLRRVGQFGEGLFLRRDDGHVVAGRARGLEDEEREPAVTGDESEAHLLVGQHFFGAPRRAAQDDAALRRADEVDQVLALRRTTAIGPA